jgi:queuosine precursor transporter
VTPDRPAFKYLDLVYAFGLTAALISNTIEQKPVPFLGITTTAGIFLFPFVYIVGDVVTEVYGYARARRLTWIILAANVIMALSFWLAVGLPHESFWDQQAAFAATLGAVPRFVLASIAALFTGDLVNCYVLSRMKLASKGKHLWMRTIGSTILGQAVDTTVFCAIAFTGTMPLSAVLSIALAGWGLKVAYEAFMTPFTYFIIAKLKKAENTDHFDYDVDYSPFKINV